MSSRVSADDLSPEIEQVPSLPQNVRPTVDSAPPPSQGRSALDGARALYRHKTFLLWTAALGIAATAIVSALQPRMYQSHAAVQILGVNENFLSLRDIYPTTAPSADNVVYVQTQAEMLRQDTLIEEVIKKLHLEEHLELLGGSAARNSSVGGADPSATDPWAIVEQVKKNLQIAPARGSSIIQIIYSARDAQLAADVANTLAQTFIDESIARRQHAASQTHEELSLELQRLRKKVAASRAELDSYNLGFGGGGADRYNGLTRESDANRQFYNLISRRAAEAGLASTLQQSNVLLVGPARPSVSPYQPNLPLNFAVGLFASLAFGIGYVMLREQTNSALRSPGEAAACLTVPELGAIPRARTTAFAALGLGGAASRTPPIERASLEQPSSGVSESFRAIVASLLAGSPNGDHPRTLVVTSPRPMEGKTTVVCNLGIALANIGNKVLLIDGDMRRPRLHKIFDQANSWGLSDLLREKNAVEDTPLDAVVKKTAVPHLYLLPSGTSTDNIFALLWSGRMARLLPRFRQEFDYVLMDAPPCLEFADARIIGRHAEKLLVVVRADYTGRETAHAAVERLLMDGISVMGVVVNGWDSANSNVYGYAQCRQDPA